MWAGACDRCACILVPAVRAPAPAHGVHSQSKGRIRVVVHPPLSPGVCVLGRLGERGRRHPCAVLVSLQRGTEGPRAWASYEGCECTTPLL